MVGWHHQLNVHEFEQTLVVGEGQGNLVCCSPWGCKESDTTELKLDVLDDPLKEVYSVNLMKPTSFTYWWKH